MRDVAMTRLDDQRRPERPEYGYGDPEHPEREWPWGQIFGFTWHPRGRRTDWFGRFKKDAGKWFMTFLDDSDGDTELFGVGDTPREAFESLVSRWRILNGGVDSTELHQHLESMRMILAEHGL